jgi:hypothetical protein
VLAPNFTSANRIIIPSILEEAMDEWTLRLECLRLASAHADKSGTALEIAAGFYAFVSDRPAIPQDSAAQS